jgi:hypothetical protein
MKNIFLLLILSTFQAGIYAQDNIDSKAASIPEASAVSVDSLVSYINQNFTTDEARIRAIYVWVANHISYDVPRLLARKDNPGSPPLPVADVLATRYAVCQGYADLFIALCKGAGIQAIGISGYTKFEGKVSSISHAWVAAPLQGEWYLFDPTWGAGYVRDDHFVKRFNNKFYKALPATFIADHMPFDPVFQFLSSPLTHKEFIDGTGAGNKSLFNFRDSLKTYNELSPIQQVVAELRRLEQPGSGNSLVQERMLYLKKRVQSFDSKNSYNAGAQIFSKTTALYKEFIDHKNKQFTAIGDNDLREMMDTMVYNAKMARALVSQANPVTEGQSQAKMNTLASMGRFWDLLDRQKQFTDRYLAATKAERRQLFLRR